MYQRGTSRVKKIIGALKTKLLSGISLIDFRVSQPIAKRRTGSKPLKSKEWKMTIAQLLQIGNRLRRLMALQFPRRAKNYQGNRGFLFYYIRMGIRDKRIRGSGTPAF